MWRQGLAQQHGVRSWHRQWLAAIRRLPVSASRRSARLSQITVIRSSFPVGLGELWSFLSLSFFYLRCTMNTANVNVLVVGHDTGNLHSCKTCSCLLVPSATVTTTCNNVSFAAFAVCICTSSAGDPHPQCSCSALLRRLRSLTLISPLFSLSLFTVSACR